MVGRPYGNRPSSGGEVARLQLLQPLHHCKMVTAQERGLAAKGNHARIRYKLEGVR
jgi:hypothetical protein